MEELYPLKGKTILITGATAGIGQAAAQRLYGLGAQVILHGRNPVRLERTINQILEAVPDFSAGGLDVLKADLADLDEVYEMTEAFKKRYQRLDVLINNAGALFLRRQQTNAGLEKTFVVNHLAHFLITRQLLDVIKASAPSRIITISSSSHFKAQLDFSDLQLKENYSLNKAYANSKLCNLLFAFELSRRFRRTPDLKVTSNAMHPGLVPTEMGKNNGWAAKLGVPAYHFFNRLLRRSTKPEQAAETLVYLASDPDVASVNGKYFVDSEPVPTSVPSYDHDLAAHLWGISELMVQQHVTVLQTELQAKESAALEGFGYLNRSRSDAGGSFEGEKESEDQDQKRKLTKYYDDWWDKSPSSSQR